jgi:hypothetical protein
VTGVQTCALPICYYLQANYVYYSIEKDSVLLNEEQNEFRKMARIYRKKYRLISEDHWYRYKNATAINAANGMKEKYEDLKKYEKMLKTMHQIKRK